MGVGRPTMVAGAPDFFRVPSPLMADQIVLAWTVHTAGTTLTAAQAATQLAAVPLYTDPTTDPVLGQALGLTVASDATAPGVGSATRTLTLNMTAVPGAPFAPPPFPCHPDSATPPTLPYVLRKTTALAGEFLVTPGSLTVPTSASQVPALRHNDVVQFLSQLGVFYTVNVVTGPSITLTTPYTGKFVADSPAVVVRAAPIANDPTVPGLTLGVIYSSSSLDTTGISSPVSVPPIPAGSGAQGYSLSYLDSTGAPFTTAGAIYGKLPTPILLAGGSVDIAIITDLHIIATGPFKNSVGQITLAELSESFFPIESRFLGSLPGSFQKFVDAVQNKIVRSIAYLPPSYFALAAQGASQPQLAGDFLVTTGQPAVFTTEDQTGAISPTDVIRFAAQPERDYTVLTVTPSIVTLTTPYTGFDKNKIDSDNDPRPTNHTADAQKQPTGAWVIGPSPAAPPSNEALASPLSQFVNPGTAVPPPGPPLPPGAMAPALTVSPGAPPNFLSSLFTQTLQLALAAPVVAEPVTLL